MVDKPGILLWDSCSYSPCDAVVRKRACEPINHASLPDPRSQHCRILAVAKPTLLINTCFVRGPSATCPPLGHLRTPTTSKAQTHNKHHVRGCISNSKQWSTSQHWSPVTYNRLLQF